MSPLVLTLFTFFAVALAIGGVYSLVADLVLRDRTRVSQRVDEEFRKRQRDKARAAAHSITMPPLTCSVWPVT